MGMKEVKHKIIRPEDWQDTPNVPFTRYEGTTVEVNDLAAGKRLADMQAEKNRTINRFVRGLGSENKDEALQEWARTTTTFEKLSVLIDFVQNVHPAQPTLCEFGVKFILLSLYPKK